MKKLALVAAALVVSLVLGLAGFVVVAMGTLASSAAASGCPPAGPGADASTASADASTASAKTIYAVFSAWGMPDENIAGVLGNWEQESGLDPTRVQRTKNTPFGVSPEEQEGAEDTANGIGLGQWTFGRNTNLRNYAAAHGKSWGDLEIQLGFMLSKAEGGNAGVVRDMIANSKGSPQAAARYFHDEWERSADTSTATREANAVQWMSRISGWEANVSLGQAILAQADATLEGKGTAAPAGAPSAGCVTGSISGEMALPLDQPYQLTSGYGPRDIDVPGASSWHAAIDLQNWPGNCGSPVYAILPGTVTLSSSLWLSIKHPDGFVVSYLHMVKSDRVVDVGDQVVAGQQIGKVGNVPPSGGCHLDLRINVADNTNPQVAQLTLSQNETRMPPATLPQHQDFVDTEQFMRLWGVEVCPEDWCKRL